MPEPNGTTKNLPISPPQFLFKTISELTASDKEGLRWLFEEVFHRPFPESLFDTKYAHRCLGYSFRVLMTIGDTIVGSFPQFRFAMNFLANRDCLRPPPT
jgi:hypothetical protein